MLMDKSSAYLTKIIVWLFFLVICFMPLNAHTQEKSVRIEKLLHSKKLFNGSVLVSDGGKIIFQKGYGYANFEWEIPNTSDTKFKLGSITKQFTAMLIMQLVEDGKISLQAKLSHYLPYYRKDIGNKITIHHLLTHTSGIPSLYSKDYPEFENALRKNPYSVDEIIKKFRSENLMFEPGSAHHYSNSGYYILGAVIEKVTGKSYESVLKEKILNPLKMVNSGFDHQGVILPSRASGYSRHNGTIKNVPPLDLSVIHAAGAMYSTVEDLYLWDQALYSSKLLSAESKEVMFQPYLNNYAYGWRVNIKYFGSPLLNNEFFTKVVEHGGRINGFNALLMRLVDNRHLIVILSNIDKGVDNSIPYEIIKILHSKPQ